jgi:hypothetical protein
MRDHLSASLTSTKQQPDQGGELMFQSKSITSDFDLYDAISDIALRFADSPLHRIGFDIIEADLQTSKAHREPARPASSP